MSKKSARLRRIVREKGINTRTRVKTTEGESVLLLGMPSGEYDASGMVALAVRQVEPCKATVKPEGAVASAATTTILMPPDAASFTAVACDCDMPEYVTLEGESAYLSAIGNGATQEAAVKAGNKAESDAIKAAEDAAKAKRTK